MLFRQRFWIDGRVQGALIGRVGLYWACGVAYLAIGSAMFQYWQHPEWTLGKHASVFWEQSWPWIPTLIMVLPLVMFDVVRMSNLFAGPIYRLKVHLKQLLEDPECKALTFRSDDYWQELSEPINVLQSRILELQDEVEILRKKTRLLANNKPGFGSAPKATLLGETTSSATNGDLLNEPVAPSSTETAS